MAETTMEPWSFTIVFDEDKAEKNGYEVDTLYDYVGKNVDERGIAHIADALDRQNPRLSLDARDSVEELRQLEVSHLDALAFPRPAQHGYVPLHG